MPSRRRGPSGPGSRRTLRSMINALPTPDIQERELKELTLQLILDTKADNENTKAARGRVKLGALKLLGDIIRNEQRGSTEEALLALLQEGAEEDAEQSEHDAESD